MGFWGRSCDQLHAMSSDAPTRHMAAMWAQQVMPNQGVKVWLPVQFSGNDNIQSVQQTSTTREIVSLCELCCPASNLLAPLPCRKSSGVSLSACSLELPLQEFKQLAQLAIEGSGQVVLRFSGECHLFHWVLVVRPPVAIPSHCADIVYPSLVTTWHGPVIVLSLDAEGCRLRLQQSVMYCNGVVVPGVFQHACRHGTVALGLASAITHGSLQTLLLLHCNCALGTLWRVNCRIQPHGCR